MKLDTLKLKVNKFAYDFIDDVFPKRDLISSIGNATAKFYIDQNMYRVDTYLKPFADDQNEINTTRFMGLLDENVFVDGLVKIDISQYIPESVRKFIPAQVIIDRGDLIRILQKEES